MRSNVEQRRHRLPAKGACHESGDNGEGDEYEDASFENEEEEPSPKEIANAGDHDKLDGSLTAQQAKNEARKERLQSTVGAKTIEAMRKKGAQINRAAISKG